MAYHVSSKELDLKKIRKFLNDFKKSHSHISLGLHRLATNSSDWNSIIEQDLFFKDMTVTEDADVFIKMTEADHGLDTNEIIHQFSLQA